MRTAEGLDQGLAAFPLDEAAADFRIPPALRDPLLARLTSPGVDLELAQAAAAIGREAECDLLRRVTGLSQEQFDRKLDSLIAADLVQPHGDDVVRFRHELIREVAYETQGLAARREYHGRIADELLRTGVPSVRSDAWEAAFHLERARRYSEAIEARVGAAQRNQEARRPHGGGRGARASARPSRPPARGAGTRAHGAHGAGVAQFQRCHGRGLCRAGGSGGSRAMRGALRGLRAAARAPAEPHPQLVVLCLPGRDR